jgi:hypothetical protein
MVGDERVIIEQHEWPILIPEAPSIYYRRAQRNTFRYRGARLQSRTVRPQA